MSARLRGMTWSHPRGYDPMIACSAAWTATSGIGIEWDKRSLQDFESFPVEQLARAYDLIVIDHPHVGQITAENCLEPLDIEGREAERDALMKGSVGQSYPSYNWQGRQWAFPIDAAAQVQAIRPDLIDAAPHRWDEVLELARQGRALLPMRPPHSLMTFFTLAANLGTPCATEGRLVEPRDGARVFEMIREIVELVDPICFDMDPIAVSERMATPESRIACAPLIYGYVSYAVEGFRPRGLRFADIPAAGELGPTGSALGGTGIAVSAFSRSKQAAVDFVCFVASGEVQRTIYAQSGGQPGHAAAWDDDAVNDATGNFYRATRKTLEGAWVRPRHDGYMDFQQGASDCINQGLTEKRRASDVIADLNGLFQKSF
ncbi:MAG: extracellular solute-binding protein [Rhizobiaceae bacterium]|nr:extracellular solute-binding protein [Rhizobiaceae bacterium]